MSWTPQVSARHMRTTAVSLYALNMNFEGRRICVACFFTCLFICLFVPENRAPLLGLSEQGVRSIPYIKRCMLRVSLLRFHRAPCYLATKRRSYARAQKLAAHSRMQWFDCIGMLRSALLRTWNVALDFPATPEAKKADSTGKNTNKKAETFWVSALSSLPDSNRRPTHYECVALPAEPRKPVSAFASTHLLYNRRLWLASVFLKKIKSTYFLKNLKKVVDNPDLVVYYTPCRRWNWLNCSNNSNNSSF